MWWLSRCIHTNIDGIINSFTRLTSHQPKSSSDRFSVYSCRFRKIHVYAWKGKNHQTNSRTHPERGRQTKSATDSQTATRMKKKKKKNTKKWNKARWNKSKCHRHCKNRYFAEWTRWFIVDFRIVCFFFLLLAATLLVYSVWMRV